MGVRARQFTGRIVTVTNDKVFDEPIYNFTREFPFIWEELTLPIAYRDDRGAVERILLDAARAATEDVRRLGGGDLRRLEHDYGVTADDLEPRVYFRLTDNWLEMTARFL